MFTLKVKAGTCIMVSYTKTCNTPVFLKSLIFYLFLTPYLYVTHIFHYMIQAPPKVKSNPLNLLEWLFALASLI